MKSKKLISFLCAAAMTASTFASLAVTASAADDVVSLDFNDGETTGWTMANGTVSSKSEDGETDKYLELKGGGGGMRSCSYSLSGVSGLKSSTGFVIEFDSSIHGSNGMGRDSQATQIVFAGSNKAADTRKGYADGKDGEGIGKGFAVKYDARKPFQGDGLVINDPADTIPSDWKTLNYVAGVQDKWVRTQAVIKDGKATITMIDRAGNKIIDAQEYACDATDLATIEISCARGDYVDESGTRVEDPGIVDLDNIHVYEGDARALTTDGLRGEAAKETPIPRPDVLDAAPTLIAPSGVTPVVNQNFSTNLARVEVGATGQTIEALDGLQIALGGRADDTSPGDATTYVETADYATGDKVLVMNGGKYSATGRGPVLSAKEKLTHDSENSAVMSFMANITSPAVGGAGRLYILGDTRQAGEDNLGAYNAVMAVLATDDYTYSEGDSSDSLVIKVEPYTWYKVGIVVSNDKYRVWVAKAGEGFAKDANVQRDHVGAGESNIGIASLTLPHIAVTSGDSKGGVTNSLARIDNMLTYNAATVDELRKVLPSEGAALTPAPATPEPIAVVDMDVTENGTTATVEMTSDITTNSAVLIKASYNQGGKLVNITSEPVSLKANDKVTKTVTNTVKGDKIMLWNSLKSMAPLAAAYTIAQGAAQPTAEPKITPTPEVTEAPSAEPSTEPSAEPTPEVTPAPKFAVTVATAENGTVTADKTTAAEGETVTLTVTPADTYVLDTLTVKDASEADVAVTNNTFKMPAKAVTVTATFKAAPTVLSASGDTEAVRWNGGAGAGENTSSADTMRVNSTESGYNWKSMGLIKFAKPADKTKVVKRAVLRLYLTAKSNNASEAVNVYSTSEGDWDEAKIVYYSEDANKESIYAADTLDAAWKDGKASAIGSMSAEPIATANVTNAEGYVEFDVTDYVKVTGGDYSFALRTSSVRTPTFATKENADVNKRPQLVIDYGEEEATTVAPAAKYAVTVTNVAAEDGTLSTSKTRHARVGETITVTATAAAGKKVTVSAKAKDNSTVELTPGENGTYTFTMPAQEVTVSAEYARADIDTIEVSGPKTVSSAATSTYTAVAKAADGTVLEGVTFTWSVTGGAAGTTITSEGVLTVSDDDADQTALTIKAAAEEKEGTLAASVTKATVYTITKAEDLTGGSVATDKIVGIEGAEVTVTPTAAAGYHVTAVTYTPAEGTAQTITAAEGVYKFTMPAANVTVSATFAKTDFAITNATASDANGTITVAATAQMGDEVTVTINPAANFALDTLTVVPTNSESTTKVTVTGNKFTMPAEAVTVTATFKSAIFFDDNFDTSTVAADTVLMKNIATGNLDNTHAKDLTGLTMVGNVRNNSYALHTITLKADESDKYIEAKVGNCTTSNGGIEIDFDGAPTAKSLKYTVLEMDVKMTSESTNAGFNFTKNTTDKVIGNDVTNGLTLGEKVNLKVVKGDNAAYAIVTAADGKVYVTNVNPASLGNMGLIYFGVGSGANNKWSYINIYGMKLYETNDEQVYPATITVKAGEAAVEGADVTVAGQTIKTNAEGKVTVNVPAGSYEAAAAKSGYTGATGTLTVAADGTNSLDIAITAQPKHDVTFALTPATATLVVKRGDEVVEPKTEGGLVYEFIQGVEYSYTVTPATADANTYDPKSGTFTATADNTKTVNVILDAKTYSLKVANVPGTSTVSYSTDNGANYVEAGKTGNAGQLLTENEIVTSGIQSGSTVKVKFVKAGYTDKVVDVTINGADGTADAAGWVPTDTTLLFSETFGALVNNAYGSWSYATNTRGNGIQCTVADSTVEIGTPVFDDNEYTFQTALNHFSSSSAGNTLTYKFLDQNDKVVAALELKINTAWTADIAESYLYVGDVAADNTTKTQLTGWAGDNKVNAISIKVNKTTGAVEATLTPTGGTATTATGTITGVGVVKKVQGVGCDKNRIKLAYFKVAKVTE